MNWLNIWVGDPELVKIRSKVHGGRVIDINVLGSEWDVGHNAQYRAVDRTHCTKAGDI